jgi:hypothetical protein
MAKARAEARDSDPGLSLSPTLPKLGEDAMRKGGLEPKAPVEMIEEFRGECGTVWHRVAPLGPPGAKHVARSVSYRILSAQFGWAVVIW